MTVTPKPWEDREEGAVREKEVEDEFSKRNDLAEHSGGSCPWPAPLRSPSHPPNRPERPRAGPTPGHPNLQSAPVPRRVQNSLG